MIPYPVKKIVYNRKDPRYHRGNSMKKYTLEELYISMKVYKYQLSEIYDTYIILTNVVNTDKGLYGTVGFIGKVITDEVRALRSKGIPITSVYNNSSELEEDIYYEG